VGPPSPPVSRFPGRLLGAHVAEVPARTSQRRQAQRVDRTTGESNLGGKGLVVAGAIGHEKSCPISRFPHSYRDRASFPKRALHGGIFSPVICGHTHPWEWEIVTG
jgi:hypothetical protein